MSGLHIDGVSMTFELPGGGKVEALKNINLEIGNGELLSVLSTDAIPGATSGYKLGPCCVVKPITMAVRKIDPQ